MIRYTTPDKIGLSPSYKESLLEIVVFTLNAIVVYLIADRLLLWIEKRRGQPVAQRQLAFMAIFLVLILVSFQILQHLFRS